MVFRARDVGSVDLEREFDAAVGRFVLMFVDDPAAVLHHLSERLRPGGIVAFQEFVALGAHANLVDDKKPRRRDTRTPNGSIDVELLLRHATK